jgi:hypothetical protein
MFSAIPSTEYFKNLRDPGIGLPKFWNYCLYVRFVIPLCGSFFYGVTPFGLMG